MTDYQCGHEKTITAIFSVLSGANLIYGAGLLEAGISYSHTQLVLDNETFKMVRRLMEGIPVTDESLAIDSIHRAGPGGDYMCDELTMKYLRGYHSTSALMNRQNRSGWKLSTDGKDAAEIARIKANEIIATHRPSVELSDAVKAKLHAIVEAAEAEISAHPEVLE